MKRRSSALVWLLFAVVSFQFWMGSVSVVEAAVPLSNPVLNPAPRTPDKKPDAEVKEEPSPPDLEDEEEHVLPMAKVAEPPKETAEKPLAKQSQSNATDDLAKNLSDKPMAKGSVDDLAKNLAETVTVGGKTYTPWDGDTYGYESPERAELREKGASANGMRGMDYMIGWIRENPSGWYNQSNGENWGHCANAVATSVFMLWGVDPGDYMGGNMGGGNGWWLKPFVNTGAYDYIPNGEGMPLGAIALGGNHTAVRWQTADDALAGKDAAWCSQWPGDGNWSTISSGLDNVIKPVGPPKPASSDQYSGQIGHEPRSRYWTDVKFNNFPEPHWKASGKS